MPSGHSAELIESLKRAASYRHGVGEIELIETHISWVLLTGTYAYKIKKPVDLGFVDFTTLPRRRFYCEEELRLNRRLAPELYLDVVPITGTTQEPSVDGAGTVLEYAVRMQQFSQDALLSRVLERGELSSDQIEALATEVAEFHNRVEVAPDESLFGTPDRVREPVRENLRHLEIIDQDPSRCEQLRRLREWSEQEFQSRSPDFVTRKQQGCVRECHGDMHLGNMVLPANKIIIFDCIEFNESFRWIDVASETAFCAMDLTDRGRADLAHRFLNSYLEVSGDYAGLRVLRYYLVYRAMVRAKVAGIRWRQGGLDAVERGKLLDECHGYLDLAERYAQPGHPQLTITHGFSGSGKTTATTALVAACGAIRIRSDVERKRLFGYSSLQRTSADVGEKIYSADASRRTYERLAELARVALRAGFPVIVDATFLKRANRDLFRRIATEEGVRVCILDFQVPQSVLNQRIAQRIAAGADASEANVSVLRHQIETAEPLGADEQLETIIVNDEGPSDEHRLIEAYRDRFQSNRANNDAK